MENISYKERGHLDLIKCQDCCSIIDKSSSTRIEIVDFKGDFVRHEYFCNKHKKISTKYREMLTSVHSMGIRNRTYPIIDFKVNDFGDPIGYYLEGSKTSAWGGFCWGVILTLSLTIIKIMFI